MIPALIILQSLALLPIVPLEQDVTEVQGQLLFLEDPTNALKVETVLERLEEFSPTVTPDENPNFGLTTSAVWFALALENRSNAEDFILSLEYPLLDQVQLFEVDQELALLKSHPPSGDQNAFSNRFVPHRFPNFQLSGPQGQTLRVLIRVQTEGSLQVPVKIYTNEAFTRFAIDDTAGLWTYYGLMGVLIILNLFFFLAIKDRVYITYLGYLLSFLLFQMSANGVIFERLLPSSPKLNNLSFLLLVHLALFFAARFATRFNSVARYHFGLHRGIQCIQALALMGCVLSLFVPYRAIIGLPILLGTAIPTVSIAAGVLAARRGYRPAQFYVGAWSLFLLGVMAYALKSAGMLPTNFFTNYGLQLGSALEVILLTLALGDRMRATLQERDALTQRINKQTAILAEQSSKRAEAEERLRVELETKVEILSDAVHHINNPLNHIQGANEIVRHDIASIHAIIGEAIPPDPDNPDYVAFSSALEEKIGAIFHASELSNAATQRAASAVSDVRTLANIDGLALHPIPARELLRQLQERFGSNAYLTVSACEKNLKVIGNPTIYAFVLAAAIHALHRLYGPALPLRLSIDDQPRAQRAMIRLEFNNASESTSTEIEYLEKTTSKLCHVLQNLKSKLHLKGNAFLIDLNLKVATNLGPLLADEQSDSQTEMVTSSEPREL